MELIFKTTQVIDHIATGAKARESREKLNLSLRSVARKMGYSAAFISDLERGRRNWDKPLTQNFSKALKTHTA